MIEAEYTCKAGEYGALILSENCTVRERQQEGYEFNSESLLYGPDGFYQSIYGKFDLQWNLMFLELTIPSKYYKSYVRSDGSPVFEIETILENEKCMEKIYLPSDLYMICIPYSLAINFVWLYKLINMPSGNIIPFAVFPKGEANVSVSYDDGQIKKMNQMINIDGTVANYAIECSKDGSLIKAVDNRIIIQRTYVGQ